MASRVSLDEGDVVVERAGGSGQDPHEVAVIAKVLEQAGHPPKQTQIVHWYPAVPPDVISDVMQTNLMARIFCPAVRCSSFRAIPVGKQTDRKPQD